MTDEHRYGDWSFNKVINPHTPPKGTHILVEAVVDKINDDGSIDVTMPHVSSARRLTEQVVVGLPISCIQPKGTV